MTSLLKLLASGYLIGAACTCYLLLRSWQLAPAQGPAVARPSRGPSSGAVSLGIVLFCAVTAYTASALGLLVYQVVLNDLHFKLFSAGFASVNAMLIMLLPGGRKLDKIVVNAIIILGIGFLIPLLS